MSFRIVQSKQNARLKELRHALTHPARIGRDSGSEELCPLIGIEGPNLLVEALRARLRIRCIFVAQGAENLVETLPLSGETEILLLPKPLLDSALTTETPQSIAALVEPPQWSWNNIFATSTPNKVSNLIIPVSPSNPPGEPLILVLAGLQDPGNLGTILRSAEAFGATGVLSLPGTVSPWNPKAIRASAGSVFRLPLIAATVVETFQLLLRHNVQIFSTAVEGAKAAHAANLAGPSALIIGNEGNGVPAEIASQADAALTIPCPGPVESLNASIAASILLYEASRQRSCADVGSSR
jgi:TrmH family RNA methyltransferase